MVVAAIAKQPYLTLKEHYKSSALCNAALPKGRTVTSPYKCRVHKQTFINLIQKIYEQVRKNRLFKGAQRFAKS